MIKLIYDTTFKKVDEIREDDTWYVGNNKANVIECYFTTPFDASKHFPTLTLITSDNRQIFPIGGLMNEAQCLFYEGEVYYIDNEADEEVWVSASGKTLSDLDVLSQIEDRYYKFTFNLSSTTKQIVREGSMTIQVVLNEGTNDGNILNDRFMKTIDSIVVNVKKGYWDTPKIYVSSESAIQDVTALVNSSNEQVQGLGISVNTHSQTLNSHQADLTRLKAKTHAISRLGTTTSIIDSVIKTEATHTVHQGSNFHFHSSSENYDSGHPYANIFKVQAGTFTFDFRDSFMLEKGTKRMLMSSTLNGIHHMTIANPRTLYDSGYVLTDYDIPNYKQVQTEIDAKIEDNNTKVVTPISNRVEALEMLTSGIEVIGNSYYVDKTIVVQDLNGNYKDIYLDRVQLQKKATNNLDAVRFDQFTDTITNTTSNVKKYTDDKISTFENEKYKPLNTKVTNLETSQQFHAAQYEALNKKVTDFLNVSNADLDTLSELIAHLQNNSGDIESIFSALTELRNGKLNISDFTQWRDGTYAPKVNGLDTSVNNLNVKTNNLDTRLSAFENDSQIMNFSQPYEEGDNLFINVEFNLPILGVSFDVESGELILQHN